MIKPGQYLVDNFKPPKLIYKFIAYKDYPEKKTMLFSSVRHSYYELGEIVDIPTVTIKTVIDGTSYIIVDSIEEYLPPRIKSRFELINI